MFDYANLKVLHVACVVASATLFFTRGVLMLAAPAALQARWARIVPHLVDTLLLAAAVGMLVVERIDPLDSSWLTAKLVGLLLYVGLGTVALKRGRTRATRTVAWLLALSVLFYIVSVALAKRPWPF